MKSNITNSRGETYPKQFLIDTSSIDGYRFAQCYVNELLGQVYGSLDGLTDKQLNAVKSYARSRSKKKSEIIFNYKSALIENCDFILNQRKFKRKRIVNY